MASFTYDTYAPKGPIDIFDVYSPEKALAYSGQETVNGINALKLQEAQAQLDLEQKLKDAYAARAGSGDSGSKKTVDIGSYLGDAANIYGSNGKVKEAADFTKEQNALLGQGLDAENKRLTAIKSMTKFDREGADSAASKLGLHVDPQIYQQRYSPKAGLATYDPYNQETQIIAPPQRAPGSGEGKPHKQSAYLDADGNVQYRDPYSDDLTGLVPYSKPKTLSPLDIYFQNLMNGSDAAPKATPNVRVIRVP